MTHLKIVLTDSWRNIYLPCLLIREIRQRKYCCLPLAEESGRNSIYRLVSLHTVYFLPCWPQKRRQATLHKCGDFCSSEPLSKGRGVVRRAARWEGVIGIAVKGRENIIASHIYLPYNCRQYSFGLLGLISAMLILRWWLSFKATPNDSTFVIPFKPCHSAQTRN